MVDMQTRQRRGADRPVATSSVVRLDSQEVERRVFSYKPAVSQDVLGRVNSHYLIAFTESLERWSKDLRAELQKFSDTVTPKNDDALREEMSKRLSRWDTEVKSVFDLLEKGKSVRNGLDTFRDNTFDDVIRKIENKVVPALHAEMSNYVTREVTGRGYTMPVGLVEQTADNIKAITERMKSEVPDADTRRMAAILFGGWFSSSRLNHITGIQAELLDYVASHKEPAVVFYLAVGKLGPEASAENMPDLSDMIFFGRIATAGFKRITVLDEVPVVSLTRPIDNSKYIKRMGRILRRRGTELFVDRQSAYDPVKFEEIAERARAIAPHLDGRQYPEGSLEKEMSDNWRATKRYGSRGEQSALDFAAHASGYLKTKVRPGQEIEPGVPYYGDHIYLAVTAKDGRHTIGYISDTRPPHGVALLHPDKGGPLVTSVLFEAEIAKVQSALGTAYDFHRVVDENDKFLAWALTKKGEPLTTKEVYEAIDAAMDQKGNKGQHCMGIINSLLHMSDVDPVILTEVVRTVHQDFDTPSPHVRRSVAEKLESRGVPTEVADLIRRKDGDS